jgi:hypothetical protein
MEYSVQRAVFAAGFFENIEITQQCDAVRIHIESPVARAASGRFLGAEPGFSEPEPDRPGWRVTKSRSSSLEKALKIAPGNPAVHRNLALAFYKSGAMAKAAEVLSSLHQGDARDGVPGGR